MSIFHDDEDENFTPQNPNNENEERIKQFLKNIYDDNDRPVINRRGKRKLIDVVLKLGIESFITSFPKIIHSEFYETLMVDLYDYYTKTKFDNLRDIDIENIVYMVNQYEFDEEYEKCQRIIEIYDDIEYRK